MRLGIQMRAQAEIDGVGLLAWLAFQGYGAAILPATAASGWIEISCRRIAVGGLSPRSVGIAMPRRGRPSAPARASGRPRDWWRAPTRRGPPHLTADRAEPRDVDHLVPRPRGRAMIKERPCPRASRSRTTARANPSRSRPPRAVWTPRLAQAPPQRLVLRRGVHDDCTRSAITEIDGDAGILRYRGYPIEQLAESSTYLEVAYLLIHGELPTQEEYDRWVHDIYHVHPRERASGPRGLPLRRPSHGDAGLGGRVLSTFYLDAKDIHDPENRLKQIVG